MQISLRTIWVTTLTLVALVLSNLASATSLMPLKMLVDNQMVMTIDSMDAVESHCGSAEKITEAEPQECCGSGSMSADHQCSYSQCAATYAVFFSSRSDAPQYSFFIPIANVHTGHISAILSALFRPPIA